MAMMNPQPYNYNPYMQQSQFQQPYNPYMDRMNNLQQFQQSLQQPMMPTQMSGTSQFTPLGKIVESVDMVKATDIPMDGNMYYFPKADGTEIYCKQWLANGQTRILAYKPILEDETNNTSQNSENLNFDVFTQFLEGIQSDVRTLSDKIDRISKPTRSKKEVSDDE